MEKIMSLEEHDKVIEVLAKAKEEYDKILLNTEEAKVTYMKVFEESVRLFRIWNKQNNIKPYEGK